MNRLSDSDFDNLMKSIQSPSSQSSGRAFFEALQRGLDSLRIERCFSACRVGTGTAFYDKAEVINLGNNIDHIQLGRNCHVRGELMRIRSGGYIHIGDRFYLGENSRIWSAIGIDIGDDVTISHSVTIVDSNGHELEPEKRLKSAWQGPITENHESLSSDSPNIASNKISIGNNVIIFPNVVIRRGVTIGDGSVVGAASVINRDIPPRSVVVGNPSRVIKTFPALS